jgi:hypothetical protein
MDKLADKPFMRKVVWRLPNFMRPKAVAYSHIIAIDSTGKVLENLQDPDGTYPINTAVTETEEYIYVGSLVAPAVGRLKKKELAYESVKSYSETAGRRGCDRHKAKNCIDNMPKV